MKYFSTLIIALFSISTLFCQTIFVKQNGNGDGSSWQQATGDLQVALQASYFGVEIWVAEGIYKPTFCSNCGEPQRNTAFIVKDGVKLLGGFKGTETQSDQRVATQNLTILSGDIDNDNTLANNSYTILLTEGVSNQTLIDGFTIQDGNADFDNAALGDRHNSGGGFYNNGQLQGFISHPVIRNCIFTNNYAFGYGGAVYSDGSFKGNASPLFENVKFINNTAKNSGGGFYANAVFEGLCDPVFKSCEFKGNKALDEHGGAMVNSGGTSGISNPLIEDCRFESNNAHLNGGAVFNFGNNGHSNPIFKKTVFIRNEADEGGAVYSDGSFSGETSPKFFDCDFFENHSLKDGGAIYNLGSSNGFCQASFERCNFENNRSTDSGGAILNNGSSGTCVPRFSNCEFKQNIATAFGAVFYNIGNAGHCNPDINNCLFVKNRGFSAGAIYNLGSDRGQCNPNITNSTFVGNRAQVGGAIYCNANDENGQSNPVISNCIFYDNYAPTGRVFRIIYGFPTVEYCSFDLDRCDELTDHSSSNINCGDGLIFSQELYFVDTLSGNYRLKEGASVIEQGNPMNPIGGVDLDSNPRVVNGRVDLGAYEFQGNNAMPPVITEQPQSKDACENEIVTFDIVASSNEAMSYQWKKDGSPIIGATQSVYQISSVSLQNVGNYTCAVTNTVGTIESSTVTLNVEERVEFSISLSSPSTVCEGAEVMVKATHVNGGNTPKYMWSLNGNPINGAIEDSVIVSGIFGIGEVTCRAISEVKCVIEDTQVATVDITSVPFLSPMIQLEGPDTIVCEGELVRFESSLVHEGTSPTFEWSKNNVLLPTTTAFYEASDLEDGDVIQCFMTSSVQCPTSNPVFSNQIIVPVDSCKSSSTLDIGEKYHISLYPNPVESVVNFDLEGMDGELIVTIYNAAGSVLEKKIVMVYGNDRIKSSVEIHNYPSGIYFMNFKNEKKSATHLFVKK